jgi:hypothetical protein
VPTRTWLAATRVRTAPGSAVPRRTASPGRHRGQRAGRRHAERGHGLADEVLAEHRAQRGAAVAAAAGEGRASGALELDVAPRPVPPHHLAEQDGAPVAEPRHEVAELVPGVGERHRLRAPGHAVAGQDLDALGAGQLVGVEPEALGQVGVQPHEPRCCHGRRVEPGVEALGQARVAVVERDADRHAIGPRADPRRSVPAARPVSPRSLARTVRYAGWPAGDRYAPAAGQGPRGVPATTPAHDRGGDTA